VLPDDYDLPPYDGPTVRFVIRHAAALEDEALLFARRLFAELDTRIEALTLTPVEQDVFEVWLDDELVHRGAEASALGVADQAWHRLGGKPNDPRS
jgi:hypothetical protein